MAKSGQFLGLKNYGIDQFWITESVLKLNYGITEFGFGIGCPIHMVALKNLILYWRKIFWPRTKKWDVVFSTGRVRYQYKSSQKVKNHAFETSNYHYLHFVTFWDWFNVWKMAHFLSQNPSNIWSSSSSIHHYYISLFY